MPQGLADGDPQAQPKGSQVRQAILQRLTQNESNCDLIPKYFFGTACWMLNQKINPQLTELRRGPSVATRRSPLLVPCWGLIF